MLFTEVPIGLHCVAWPLAAHPDGSNGRGIGMTTAANGSTLLA